MTSRSVPAAIRNTEARGSLLTKSLGKMAPAVDLCSGKDDDGRLSSIMILDERKKTDFQTGDHIPLKLRPSHACGASKSSEVPRQFETLADVNWSPSRLPADIDISRVLHTCC